MVTGVRRKGRTWGDLCSSDRLWFLLILTCNFSFQSSTLRGVQGQYCVHHMENEVGKIPLKNLKLCSVIGPYLRCVNITNDSKMRHFLFLEEETRAQRSEVLRPVKK